MQGHYRVGFLHCRYRYLSAFRIHRGLALILEIAVQDDARRSWGKRVQLDPLADAAATVYLRAAAIRAAQPESSAGAAYA